MPHLRSREGVTLLKHYVENWPSILMVYFGLKTNTTARFRDGTSVALTKSDRRQFVETLYRKYLEDKGFHYRSDTYGRTIIHTPDGLQLIMLPIYSLVFDEIYLMCVYGRPDLTGITVVDVGASIGDSVLYFCKLGAKHVFAFEMNHERCEIMHENIAMNNMTDKVTVFESSAHFDSINSLPMENAFLKVDCDGCEYQLLDGLDLAKFSSVVLEYHKKAEPIVSRLESAGFDTQRRGEIISATRIR